VCIFWYGNFEFIIAEYNILTDIHQLEVLIWLVCKKFKCSRRWIYFSCRCCYCSYARRLHGHTLWNGHWWVLVRSMPRTRHLQWLPELLQLLLPFRSSHNYPSFYGQLVAKLDVVIILLYRNKYLHSKVANVDWLEYFVLLQVDICKRRIV